MKDSFNSKYYTQLVKERLAFYKNMTEEKRASLAYSIKKDIDLIDVDKAFHKVKRRLRFNNSYSEAIRIITQIAAIITLPLLVFTIWSLFNNDIDSTKEESEITWQEIQTPYGIRSYIQLPDGTDLWLNSGTKIKYSIPFLNDTRQLYLSGEAFLNVAENRKVPFIVNTPDATVKVLGTQFNLKAYSEDESVEVALKEGNVEFYYTNNNGNKVYTKLKPNDYIVLDKETNSVVRANKDIGNYIVWHQNILIFDDTPMKEVAAKLEKWYGIKVLIADKEILDYKFTTTFENEPLFRVLELLELSSPISIKYTPGTIDKATSIASPSIVTISKK